MPLFIEGHRIPPRWAETKSCQQAISIDSYVRQADCIQIAFVNNMPDAALEDTEMQFLNLLDGAAGDTPLRLSLYSLPGIPRGERGENHLRSFYGDFNDLWRRRLDAVIVTGTEPCSTNLQEEPYWPALVNLLDWAERNTISAVFSCLAAHASALHSDGITRSRLSDKRFGVFEFNKVSDHQITRDAKQVRFPHSRWNEVQATALTECGYVLLTVSADAGVDTFVKTKKNSLFVHFQGHPEYGAMTLLKEYRRDIKRFLRGERETYPSLPQGYFDTKATKLLMNFQRVVLSEPREELMTVFPEAEVVDGLQNGWHACAAAIYRNWLAYMKSRKLQASRFAALSSSGVRYRKRSAVQ
jgi:homoserine O-succinyltransferase/O-acetyltransferase